MELAESPQSNYSPEQGSSQADERERYTEAKELRKRADEDAKILANRIALLKAEEQKAWKKIDETRKRARQIMETRQRNLEAQRRRQELARAKDEQEKIRAYNNRVQKEQIKDNQRAAKENLMSKLKSEVAAIKRNKAANRDIIAEQREDHQLKNTMIKQQVQNQKREAAERRRQQEEEKRQQARLELEQKIEEETRLREEKEALVAAMEQEELQLIQKLQNTQLLQRDAYENLENAISGGDVVEPPEEDVAVGPDF